jgi:hypothetical protein
MAKIIPFTPDRLEELKAAASADGHAVIEPTALLVEDGKIRGYAGLGLPVIFFWSHTGNSPRATFEFADYCEKLSGPRFVVPCTADSPLFPYMEHRGYERLGNADFFLMRK